MSHRWVQMHRPWLQITRQWVQEGTQGAGAELTDTIIMRLPIDCVMAGHQPYRVARTEFEVSRVKVARRAVWSRRTFIEPPPKFPIKNPSTGGYD